MAGNTAQPGATVTSRVMAILGSFDESHHQQSLTDISARSGIAMTTTHRIVRELEAWGALKRRGDGMYVIGRRLWDVGLLAPVERGLREIASPFLHDIYDATFATVHLGVREGVSVLYLDRLSGHASVSVVSQIGTRLPLHATGVGKVLLAHAPQKVQDEVMGSLCAITPHTITDPDRLRADLDSVLARGYAETVEEMTLGACSLGVPVRRGDGSVIAAVGVVVPGFRQGKTRLVSVLETASRGIGLRLQNLSR
ncbi:MAG: kdgR 3 [Aeromicrobium sp.]|jgi:DNA-binding IclR family transcriptional regulator|nr:kdgR 3 [Aeromicrobium sp.]